MEKKLIAIICSISLFAFSSTPVNAAETVRYKDSSIQTIKKDKWVTLKFNGKTAIKGNGQRSLFCYQAAVKMNGKKKPKYIKLRLVRQKSGGSDSTATNIYPVTSKPGSTWVGSNCWSIFTNSPVVVQIRITGGSKTYQSDMRQFKMWTPGADYPQDFSDFIPEATIN
jgi:hypothetical protein